MSNKRPHKADKSWGVWIYGNVVGGHWQRADGVRPMAWTHAEAVHEAARMSELGIGCEARGLTGEDLSASRK